MKAIALTFLNVDTLPGSMDSLLSEVMLVHPRQLLGKFQLDWMPQPGHYLDIQDQTYLVLERHHHYQYRAGKYRLHKVSLHVQSATRPAEKSLINGRWIVGDATCRFNARSEILRCAVNPDGPCQGCRFYEVS